MANEYMKGITIEIGATTTALDKALKDTGKKTADLSKELATVNKQLEFDPKNTVLLAQKQAILTDAVRETETRLEALRRQQEAVNAAFKNGDASAEEVRKVERQIIANERRLTEYKNQLKSTGSTTSTVSATSAAGWSKAASAVAVAVTAVTALTTALGKLTVNGAAYADEILTTATVTGIATNKLQAYRYAAELVDVSVETLTASMRRNIRSMSNARDGSEDAAAAYAKLGISITNADGSLRQSDEVFWEAIDALGQMANETERDAVAMELFGKSAQDLNPLIESGSKKMAELATQAEKVGYIMDNEQLTTYGALDDTIQQIKLSAESASYALGSVLLPAMQEYTDRADKILSGFSSRVKEGDIAGAVTEAGSEAVSGVLDLLNDLLDNLPAIIQGSIDVLEAALPLIVERLPDIIDAISDTIPALVDGLVPLLVTVLGALIRELPDIIVSLNSLIVQSLSSIIVFFIQLFNEPGGRFFDWIKDKFKTLGSDILGSIVDGIVADYAKFWGKVGEIFSDAWEKIKGFFGGDTEVPDTLTVEAAAEDALRRTEVAVSTEAATRDAQTAAKLDELIEETKSGKNIYLDGDTLVGGTADRMDEALGARAHGGAGRSI